MQLFVQRWRGSLLYFAWATALVAVLGSLYFQYVLDFAPCVLCWYQRVALYPLVVIIPIGIIRKDFSVAIYSAVLSGVGGVAALYHTLLYYKVLPESAAPCVQGVSCLTQYIDWFGFVSIPLLSLVACIIIFTASMLARTNNYE